MSHPALSTTFPSRTFTMPTEQALALDELAVSKSIAVKSRGTPRCCHAPSDNPLGHAAMRDYAQRVPDIDPIANPVGFWVLFAIFSGVVIGLLALSFYYLRSVIRAARERQDPDEVAALKKFDEVEERQRQLDEQLKAMRDRKQQPPPD